MELSTTRGDFEITDLNSDTYGLKRPLTVTLYEPEGKPFFAEYRIYRHIVFAEGENRVDALNSMKEHVIQLYEELNNSASLELIPTIWLHQLNEVIERKGA